MAAIKPLPDAVTPYCSIERALAIVGDRWSFLVLREVLLYRRSRFGDIRDHLGIASNVLADRLEVLVEAGVLEKGEYRRAGSRSRPNYFPTRAGLDLKLVLAALQQWGDLHEPRADGPTIERVREGDAAPVAVAFVAADGEVLDIDGVGFKRTGAYPVEEKTSRDPE